MCPAKMAKLESAMRVALEFNEAFNRHDLAGIINLISDECIIESSSPPPDGEVFKGREEVARYWLELFHHSPDARREIEEIFSTGFRCIMRWKSSHLDGSGIKHTVKGVDIFRVDGGLITEILSYIKG